MKYARRISIILLLMAALGAPLLLRSVSAQAQTGQINSTAPAGTPFLVDGIREIGFPKAVVATATICPATPHYYVNEGDRYRFVTWRRSGGPLFAQCVNPHPTEATTAVFAREYLIRVTSSAPGVTESRWVEENTVTSFNLAPIIPETDQARWRFRQWNGGETPHMATNLVASVRAVTLEAQYEREFLVRTEGPAGVVREHWVANGAAFVVEAPAPLSGFVFSQWTDSLAGTALSKQAKLQLEKVTGPLRLVAEYSTSAPRPPAAALITFGASQAGSLEVDGRLVEELPVHVREGSRVCVASEHSYLSDTERTTFAGWSDKLMDLCRVAQPGSSVNALFRNEVVLQITSDVAAAQSLRWVPVRTPVQLEAPEIEDDEGTRWIFERWTAGERPSSRTNTFVVTKPAVIEAKYREEFLVQVLETSEAAPSGGGWVRAGQRMSLTTPGEISKGPRERLRFVRWVDTNGSTVGIKELESAVAAFPVNRPLTLKPEYALEFLVNVKNPQGVLKTTWVSSGQTLALESPESILIQTDKERLIFKQWQERIGNIIGEVGRTRTVAVGVTRPMEIEAEYTREYFIKLDAPFGGTGTGWYRHGETATLSVSPQPQGVIFFKKVFRGYAGYPGTDAVMQLIVDKPAVVAAVYKNDIDWRFVGILALALAAIGVFWRITESQKKTADAGNGHGNGNGNGNGHSNGNGSKPTNGGAAG